MDPKFPRDMIRFMVIAFGMGLVTYAILETLARKQQARLVYDEPPPTDNVVPFKKTVH